MSHPTPDMPIRRKTVDMRTRGRMSEPEDGCGICIRIMHSLALACGIPAVSSRTYPKHEERIMFWIQDHVRTAKHIHWIKFQFLNNKVRILMSESTGQGYNIINMNNVYNLITYQMFTWLLNVINNVSIQKTDTDWSYRNYYRDIKHTIAIYRYLPR